MAAASICCGYLRQSGVDAPVMMISGHGTIADAVEATRAGAFDFLEKPLGRDRVLLALKNALEQSVLREENQRLREMVGSPSRDDRHQSRVAAGNGAGHHGGAIGCARPADGRIGHGQGVAGRAYPRAQPLRVGAVREGELRGDPYGVDRE